MAYTDEGVRAKLSALNETQESIVTVAQWIMFHRRYADRSAGVWLQKVRDSGASKRLNLVYLANEVVQQSKARKKDDFLIAFSPIIAEAVATAYRGATTEVQTKLRRVVEVWKQRAIFDPPIQEAVEARINEIDKSRSSGKKPLLGGINPFSAASSDSVPPELARLLPLQITANKAHLSTSSVTASLSSEYDRLLSSSENLPPPPVYAARLSGLLKNLATASGAVAEGIKARQALISGLDDLLKTNQKKLAEEEAQRDALEVKKVGAEAKKREVEDEILRGQTEHVAIDDGAANHPEEDDDRPQMEALTPPPVESFTPPEPSPVGGSATAAETVMGSSRPFEHSPLSDGVAKRRKLDNGDPAELMGGDAMADLDDEVAELLRAEGQGI